MEEKAFKVKLTVIDTPGFGDYVNNRDRYVSPSTSFFLVERGAKGLSLGVGAKSWGPIVEFVDDQHEMFMRQEQQPRREDKTDLRVHACLYFVRPTGHTFVFAPFFLFFALFVHGIHGFWRTG